MNEDKPTWWSFFAWPLVGAALVVSILGLMTIGLFVLPLALIGLHFLLKFGGNRKSSVGVISGAGLPFLFVAYLNRNGPQTVCSPYENGGQQCTLEKSPWLFVFIGAILVLLGAMLLMRLRSDSGMSSGDRGLLLSILIVIWLGAKLVVNQPALPPMATESGRVQNAFEGMFSAVSKKEVVPFPWLIPVQAGVVSYPDGSKVSLWVPKSAPEGNRSSCFYVDQPSKGGASGFYDSLCSIPKSEVILERQGPVVVGYVRMTKAHFATIASGGITVDAPITFGYFIFPSVVLEDRKAKFTISFIDPGGATCKVVDLPAPGSSASVECVIA